jgi:hypothetical protein
MGQVRRVIVSYRIKIAPEIIIIIHDICCSMLGDIILIKSVICIYHSRTILACFRSTRLINSFLVFIVILS